MNNKIRLSGVKVVDLTGKTFSMLHVVSLHHRDPENDDTIGIAFVLVVVPFVIDGLILTKTSYPIWAGGQHHYIHLKEKIMIQGLRCNI